MEPTRQLISQALAKRALLFPEGKARLCVTRAGLWGSMRVHNLTWENAYTVWWVYIDQPLCFGGVGFWQCIGTFFGDPESDKDYYPQTQPPPSIAG